jgi:hypothetical protein
MRVSVRTAMVLLVAVTYADTAHAQSEGELAKEAQNPIASLISLPFQSNTNFGVGPNDATQEVLNIQPVVPFKLGDDWNLITRTILPLIYQPAIPGLSGDTFGLGDLNPTLFFSPAGSGLTWGFGPSFLLPTATADVLGGGKWAAGPAAVVVDTSGPWVFGALISNIWSFAGDSDRADINRLLVQPFVNYNLSQGWYLTSSPVVTADWEAASDQRWTVPIGGGVGKILRIGTQPVNMSLQGYWNAVSPDNGSDWTIRFQVQFLFPR